MDDNITYYSLRENIGDKQICNRDKEDYEPSSIKQLNVNLTENSNKIQQTKNDIQAKNNLIETKQNQINDDEKFLKEVEKEKNGFVDNLNEEVACELGIFYYLCVASGFREAYQIKIFKFIFEFLFTFSNKSNKNTICNYNSHIQMKTYTNINNPTTNSSYIAENDHVTNDTILNIDSDISEKHKNNILNKFRNDVVNKFQDFKNKLKEINFIQCGSGGVDKLREINQSLENLKIDSELIGKDEFYENFYYYLFKYLKLIIFTSLGKLRIEKLNNSIEKVTNIFYKVGKRRNKKIKF